MKITKIFCSFGLGLCLLFSFNFILAQEGCIPYLLLAFTKSPEAFKCSSGDSKIIAIGDRVTRVFTYQPEITNEDDFFNKVTTVYEGTAHVAMNQGDGIKVESELIVEGIYKVKESYNSLGHLVQYEDKFTPFSPGQNGNRNGNGQGNGGLNGEGLGDGTKSSSLTGLPTQVFPISIESEAFYFDNQNGEGTSCLTSYSVNCIEQTYSESIEFNPDLGFVLNTNSKSKTFHQNSYKAPKPILDDKPATESDEAHDSSEQTENGNNSKPDSRPSPATQAWQLKTTIESYKRYKQSSAAAAAKNKEFDRRVAQQLQDYRRQIEALHRRNREFKKEIDEIIKELSLPPESLSSTTEKSKTKKANWYDVDIKFKHHQHSDEALKILRALMEKAKSEYSTREYITHMTKILNTKGISSIPGITNSSGILQTQSYDSRVAKGPFDNINLLGIESVHNQRIARDIANKFHSEWLDSRGMQIASDERLYLYSVGIGMYKHALSFANSDNHRFLSYSEMAMKLLESSVKFGTGLAEGVWDNLYGTLTSLPELIATVGDIYGEIPNTNAATTYLAYKIALSMPQIKDAMFEAIEENYEKLIYGNAHEKGEVVGKFIAEVGTTLIPVGGLKAAVKSTKIVPKLSDINTFSKITTFTDKPLLKKVRALPDNKRSAIYDTMTAITKSKSSFVQDNAQDIVEQMVKSSDIDVVDTMKKMVASTADFEHKVPDFPPYIVKKDKAFGEGNLQEIFSDSHALSSKLNDIPTVKVEGFVARYSPKEHLKEGVSPLKEHPGNYLYEGRYSIGGSHGDDVLSFGFGQSKETALDVAYKEAGVEGLEDLFKSDYKRYEIDHILDLTDKQTQKNLGIDLVAPYEKGSGYFWTQIISSMSQKKGASGILAPSYQKPGEKVLHIFDLNKGK